MPNDPDPIAIGDSGKVVGVNHTEGAQAQIDVEWESGRTLYLLENDPFSITIHNPCPQCGQEVRHWHVPNSSDPGDVDPAGRCTNPDCTFEY